MTAAAPKFVFVTGVPHGPGNKHVLYALDASGGVWRLNTDETAWVQLTGQRKSEQRRP